jgi:hypothetical protein
MPPQKQAKLCFTATSPSSSSTSTNRKRPRPTDEQSDLVQCPSCSASFGSVAAVELHLSSCLDREARHSKLKGAPKPAELEPPTVLKDFITEDEETTILDALQLNEGSIWKRGNWNGVHLNRHFGVEMLHGKNERITKPGTPLPQVLLDIIAPRMAAVPQLLGWQFNNVSNTKRVTNQDC